MPIPTVAEQLISMISPGLLTDDLRTYLIGLSLPYEVVETYASDDVDNGLPGYALFIDIDSVPNEAIPYLAQFVGVRLADGMSYADQKNAISNLGTWKRGTVAAIKAAPFPYLTGSKTVIVKERTTSAYTFEVETLTSETPDSAAVLAALIEQKPATLVMNYVVYAGQHQFQIGASSVGGPDAIDVVV